MGDFKVSRKTIESRRWEKWVSIEASQPFSASIDRFEDENPNGKWRILREHFYTFIKAQGALQPLIPFTRAHTH